MNTKNENTSNSAPLLEERLRVVMHEEVEAEAEAIPISHSPNPNIVHALKRAMEMKTPVIFMVNVPDVPSSIRENNLIILSVHDEDPRPYIDTIVDLMK